jgi:uncharacterized protein YkwD
MGVVRRAARPSRGLRRFLRVRGPVVALALAAAGLLVVGDPGDGSQGTARPLRLVLSSLESPTRALMLGTTSLYAKNDPWMSYLASEAECPGGERTDRSAAQQVRTVACLVNFARGRRGLHELSFAPPLSGASVEKADAIVRCRRFAHNPCGGDWAQAVRSTGFEGRVGENLYVASGRWGAPRVVVDAWLNSPPHRENLFRAEWRLMGVAVVKPQSFEGQRDLSLWVSVLGRDV